MVVLAQFREVRRRHRLRATFDLGRLHAITAQSESGNRDIDARGRVVTSRAGARGRMQVLDSTNTDPGYGVTPARNNSLAERARVGRDYFTALYRHYGSPAVAWAAYNAGPGRVDRALQSGRNWLSRLPRETREYVERNIAALQRGP